MRLLFEQEDRLFKMAAIEEFNKRIAHNRNMAAVAKDPDKIELYEDDASKLEFIRDTAVEQKASGAAMGDEDLQVYMSRIDTAVREQIPQDVYYWIIGEKIR